MRTQQQTIGEVIADRRAALSLSLKDLGRLVRKEDGNGVSAQYLHDIERDRRTPSPHVTTQLARALGVDPTYLAAVAGQCPPEVIQYLRDNPDQAPDVAAAFKRLLAGQPVDWTAVGTNGTSRRTAGGDGRSESRA